MEGDAKIGRYLLDTVSAMPKMDPAVFEKMFNNTLQVSPGAVPGFKPHREVVHLFEDLVLTLIYVCP